jgi:hypothetical protein
MGKPYSDDLRERVVAQPHFPELFSKKSILATRDHLCGMTGTRTSNAVFLEGSRPTVEGGIAWNRKRLKQRAARER